MKKTYTVIKFSRVTQKTVAMVVMLLHLLLLPVVHAHGIALVEPDGPHRSHPACLVADAGAGHDSTESQHHNTGICHPDTPFVVIHFQTHTVRPAIIGLSSSYAGRLLPGHPRPVYVPPRRGV